MTVRALVIIIVGHEIHPQNILKERDFSTSTFQNKKEKVVRCQRILYSAGFSSTAI
jgi:hypothetical protein